MHCSFDFDYTLADSSAGSIECVSYALRRVKLSPKSEEAIRRTIGLSLEATFAALSGMQDDSLRAAEFKQYFLERADVAMLENIMFFDDIKGASQGLKRSGHFLSIVSTKYHARISRALPRDGLDELVECIVAGDDVDKHEPRPERLLKAIESSSILKSATTSGTRKLIGSVRSEPECASLQLRREWRLIATYRDGRRPRSCLTSPS